jgi:hypothetical protein
VSVLHQKVAKADKTNYFIFSHTLRFGKSLFWGAQKFIILRVYVF